MIYFQFIYLFSLPAYAALGCRGLEPFPVFPGQERGYLLAGCQPITGLSHIDSLTLTLTPTGNLTFTVHLTCMFICLCYSQTHTQDLLVQ